MCTQLFPHQHEANETHGVLRGTNCFFSKLQKEKWHAWVSGLLRNGRRERTSQAEPECLIFFLLAPECLPAGGSSLRYYRERKPGKKTMYCFSPRPINFVINKSDSYRTACHRCLWKQGFISRFFIKTGCTVVLRASTALLSGNGCHRTHTHPSPNGYLLRPSCLDFIAGIMWYDLICKLRGGNLRWIFCLSTFPAMISGKMH